MVSLESLELGDVGVDEDAALVVFKDACAKAGLDDKVPEFLVKTVGCRILEDLEKITEDTVDTKIVSAIQGLPTPILQASRLKKLIAAVVQASSLSWDRKKRGIVDDEDTPLPAQELRRMEALFWNRYKIKIAAEEDAGETVVSRLKRQIDKSTLRFEQVLKTRTRKGETAEGKVKRTKLSENTEVVEREPAVQNEKKTLTLELYLDALYTYLVGLAKSGIEPCADKPTDPETEMSRSYEYVLCPLDVVMAYHARAKRFASTIPRGQALEVLMKVDEAERLMWTERVKTNKIGSVIAAIYQERAHVWVWHEKPEDSSRSEGSKRRGLPEPAGSPPSRPSKRRETPSVRDEIVGTWATHLRNGKSLCAKYQSDKCSAAKCTDGEHLCAMIVRNRGHVCGLRHGACSHKWEIRKKK